MQSLAASEGWAPCIPARLETRVASESYGPRAGAELPDSRTWNLIAAIETVQSEAPGLTLTQLLIFLRVAVEEGIRLNDLAARTNESQASISRNVGMLTPRGHAGSARGRGLLTLMRDRDDGRARRAAVSDKGRQLLDRIHQAIQN